MAEHDELSDEQLEAALAETVGQEEPSPEPVVPEPPAPEPPAAEPAAEPSESVEQEAAAEPEPEVSELDILRAQLAEVEARAKHWEEVSGRNGGRMGFLEQKLQQVLQQQAAPPSDDYAGETPETETPRQPAPTPGDPYRSYVIGLAVQQAGQEFARTTPDAGELWPSIEKYIGENHNPSTILLSEDPQFAAAETMRVLNAAYLHADAERKATRKTELMQRRADQIKLADEAKKKASLSAPGGSSAPMPKPKTSDEMSDSELDSALKEATRGARW